MLTVRAGSNAPKLVTRRYQMLSRLTTPGEVSWDGDFGRAGSSTAGNFDLSARDVELRGASNVQTNMLDTEQVLDIN